MAITVRTVTTFPLDDAQRDFNINFDYLARKFVQVAVIDSTLSKPRKELVLGTDFRFTTKTSLNTTIAWGPNDGYDRIEIRRVTSTTERVVDFADGSILRATDLNASQVQAIHIAEEARDAALLAMPQDDNGNLDARNRRIVRLAPGIDGTDAINKNQLDQTLGEAGGILSDMDALAKLVQEYIANFINDPASVRNVNFVYNGGAAMGGEQSFKIIRPEPTLGVPYIYINGDRQDVGYQYSFDQPTQTVTLVKPLVAGDFVVAVTAEGSIPFLDLIAGATGAASIGKAGGGTVQDGLDMSLHGTDVHKDTVKAGTVDQIMAINQVNNGRELRGKEFVMPHGTFYASRTLRTRGLAAAEPKYTTFSWKGQGSTFTKLIHPATGGPGAGDIAYMDYLKDVEMSGFSMDNTPLGAGTSNTNTKNGQFWIRHSEDSRFDDLRFAGGDALTFCLDHCKNIISTDLKVDYQLRYPVGTGKSPLIVGDYSEQCMFIGGYVKTVSPDGSIMYAGDLADNDQANDTKWAFINLYGLTFEQKPNSNACMWQEGEGAPSNAHFIGMNYVNNGIGHGVSEKAVGTDLGSTFRQAQVRAIWNRAEYISIGGHFLDNDAKYPAGTGGAGAAATGAVHNDNAKFTSLVGDYFRGNAADYTDYTGATARNPENSAHITNAKLTSLIRTAASSNSQHLAIVNSQLTDPASIGGGGNGRLHISLIGSHCIGPLGNFGHGQSETQLDAIGSTFTAAGSTETLITQSGVGNISFSKCVIREYVSLTAGNSGRVSFDNVTFDSVTFTEADLSARYINCKFINCVNSPDTNGNHFMADSTNRPSSARTTVTLGAGGTYQFPAWVTQDRGVYQVSVGGNGANLPAAMGIIGRASATGTGVWTPQFESTQGSVVVSWAPGGRITVTVTAAGNYTIGIN